MIKPGYKMYVLVSHWSWNKFHEEFATFSFENFNLDGKLVKSIEEVLGDPQDSERKTYSEILRKIADAQDGSTMDRIKLIRLYRVVSFDLNTDSPYGPHKLNFKLNPICDFDNDDNMIPVDPRKYK